jgi:hypothetical protein
MWTTPRSVSTSFERMMTARGDHTVFDEPFSRHYYYGPQRHSSRFVEELPGSSPAELLDEIEAAAHERPVFVKDMAYQASDVLSTAVLGRFRNCFLVRDPAATLRSLTEKWPDFTDEEAGWGALARAADLVTRIGQPLVVVEAAALCHDPAPVVSAWCQAMGLPFDPEALSWEPGMRHEWSLWEDWHSSTARHTGFSDLGEPPAPPTPQEPRLYHAYRQALPVYERLAAHAIRPQR